jgi:hypothetical protein
LEKPDTERITSAFFRQYVVALFLLLTVYIASASEMEPSNEAPLISGSVSGAWWSGSRSLDDKKGLPDAALWLKTEPKSSNVSAVVDGWIRNEDLSRDGSTKSRLREAFVGTSAGTVDVRAGRQILVWGRADQINPTDNLTPGTSPCWSRMSLTIASGRMRFSCRIGEAITPFLQSGCRTFAQTLFRCLAA